MHLQIKSEESLQSMYSSRNSFHSTFFTYQVCEAFSRATIGGFDGRGRQRMSCNIDIKKIC